MSVLRCMLSYREQAGSSCVSLSTQVFVQLFGLLMAAEEFVAAEESMV